jgi:curli biogenesis system outer membrane secretion channel CsgG
MKPLIAAMIAAGLLATPALAEQSPAKVDNSATSRALARIARKPGEKPVVAIYEVRSAVASIQPRAAQEMFMTALIKSGAFAVAERARLNEGVMRERQMMASGQATGTANQSQVAGAQYVFEVVISEENAGADKHDNSFSLNGAQMASRGGAYEIGMDVRITDTTTGLVVDSVNVNARIASSQSQVSGLGRMASSFLAKRGGALPFDADANLSSSHNDGVDKALRSCIEAAVAELARRFNTE